jgi:hypothetical protein
MRLREMQRDVVVVERMWAIRTPQFQKKKKATTKKKHNGRGVASA